MGVNLCQTFGDQVEQPKGRNFVRVIIIPQLMLVFLVMSLSLFAKSQPSTAVHLNSIKIRIHAANIHLIR